MVRYSDVAERVVAALAQDPRTGEFPIDVIDENGFVTLKGKVSSEEGRQAAEEIAQGQEGVINVINELQVDQDEKPATPPLVVPPPES